MNIGVAVLDMPHGVCGFIHLTYAEIWRWSRGCCFFLGQYKLMAQWDEACGGGAGGQRV